jgi:hypothetical protein
MENINITDNYFRAEKVLDSCTNLDQLKNALNYAELYYKYTNDRSGYDVLIRKYHKLYKELILDEKTENN